MEANLNNDYEIKEAEKGYVHLRCGQNVHDSAKQEYKMNYRVIKLYPAEYREMKKKGSFKQFKSTELIHMPEVGFSTGAGPEDLTYLKKEYEILFGKEADGRLKQGGLESAIAEKSEQLKDQVLESYKERFEKDPEGLTVVEQLKAIQE